MSREKKTIQVTIDIDEEVINLIVDNLLGSLSDELEAEGLPKTKEIKVLVLETAIKILNKWY